MDIKQVENALKLLNIEFESQPIYVGEWRRLFIKNSKNCSIGRMTFKNNKLFSFKCYKRDYIRELDETDYIINKINKYLNDGLVVTKDIYNTLVNKAVEIQQEDFKKKMEWRENNPKVKYDKHGNKYFSKRKKLQKVGIRYLLNKEIQKYSGQNNG